MSLEYYKKQMVDLRAKLQKEKDAKKNDNERYAALVKGASSPSSKVCILHIAYQQIRHWHL